MLDQIYPFKHPYHFEIFFLILLPHVIIIHFIILFVLIHLRFNYYNFLIYRFLLYKHQVKFTILQSPNYQYRLIFTFPQQINLPKINYLIISLFYFRAHLYNYSIQSSIDCFTIKDHRLTLAIFNQNLIIRDLLNNLKIILIYHFLVQVLKFFFLNPFQKDPWTY